MKSIVFVEKNKARLIEEDMPKMSDKKVMVKLEYSTISSGTERANLTGDPRVSAERYAKPEVKFPRRGGYSSSGVVVEVGKDVKNFKVGDRVAAIWSTHSEYIALDEEWYVKIDDETSFAEASLWHISTFPLAAIRKCRLELGESAIVMGQGVLGIMAVKLLKAAGASPIIAVDPIEEKRKFALEIGADYALSPFDEDFEKKVRDITGKGVNVAIEVTGNGQALDTVLDCMAKFGRVALLGCTRNSDFTIDYYKKVHAPGISLIGAHTIARPDFESSPGLWTVQDDIKAVSSLHKYGRIEFSSLVSEIHSPSECEEIYTRLANEKHFPIVQFDWSRLKNKRNVN